MTWAIGSSAARLEATCSPLCCEPCCEPKADCDCESTTLADRM